MYERLYEATETSQVHFLGYATDCVRLDLAIVYTERFFGKPLVICMQTGKSSLICREDSFDLDYVQRTFNLTERQEAEEVSVLLRQHLPSLSHQDQY